MATITVCMIVKNESNVLRRCLDSLKGLYEELVIVDTGSTDNTKEIAAEYTDKIYDFQWTCDFAAARNFAFSKCSMDYIYSADADEMLDDESRSSFIELKNNPYLEEIDLVQMNYITKAEFNTTENYAVDLRPKLYKRLRKFTWIDPIHESVNLNPVIYDSNINILHLPENNHADRDFGVFRKVIEGGKELSSKLKKMYARELMIAGLAEDFENAEEYFKLLAMGYSNPENDEDVITYGYIILAHLYRIKGNIEEFFKWTMKNIAIKPCAEICMELSYFYYDKEDYDEAIIWAKNAYTETEAVLVANSKNIQPLKIMIDSYEKLAVICESSLYEDMAEEYKLQLCNYVEMS